MLHIVHTDFNLFQWLTDLLQQKVLDWIQWQLIEAIFQIEEGAIVEWPLATLLGDLVFRRALQVQRALSAEIDIGQTGIAVWTPFRRDLLWGHDDGPNFCCLVCWVKQRNKTKKILFLLLFYGRVLFYCCFCFFCLYVLWHCSPNEREKTTKYVEIKKRDSNNKSLQHGHLCGRPLTRSLIYVKCL